MSSKNVSNNKKKVEGNKKNGNKNSARPYVLPQKKRHSPHPYGHSQHYSGCVPTLPCSPCGH